MTQDCVAAPAPRGAIRPRSAKSPEPVQRTDGYLAWDALHRRKPDGQDRLQEARPGALSTAPGRFVPVDVPPLPYLMVDGRGDPNTAPAYLQAVCSGCIR